MIGMHAIRKKLQSRRGASLSIALLLFLVCAVIGSLVLVAGTAAAGRLARLGESEQRFHAVNSAAELIVDQLCGEDNKVTVGIKKEVNPSDPDDPSSPPNPDNPYKYEFIMRNKDGDVDPTTDNTLAMGLAKYLVFQEADLVDITDRAAKFTECQKNSEFMAPKSFVYELKVDTGADSGESKVPDVRVRAKFINGYQLNLVVENIVEEGKTDAIFTLPTIILETDSPRGVNEEDKIEYTFNWRTPKG